MKIKRVAIIMIFLLLSVIIFGCSANTTYEPILRLHIRANSESATDQEVKLKCRDEVNAYLASLPKSKSFDEAYQRVQSNLKNIERICDEVLNRNGFSYKSRAKMSYEYFPARSYDGYYVCEGMYDALVIELGKGEGHNFWCVIYPSLCFGKISPEYKSYIWEWLQSLEEDG